MRKLLRLTRAPLTRVGEASEMYKGDAIEAIPTPRPTNTRPTMRVAGFGAAAKIIDPSKKRVSATIIDTFLPNLSLIHPPIAAPIIAPAIAVLTMASCYIFSDHHHIFTFYIETCYEFFPTEICKKFDVNLLYQQIKEAFFFFSFWFHSLRKGEFDSKVKSILHKENYILYGFLIHLIASFLPIIETDIEPKKHLSYGSNPDLNIKK